MWNRDMPMEAGPSGLNDRRSLSFNTQNRPSMVISGHRNFHTVFRTSGNIDSRTNQIVAKLEENPALMDDTPVSEQLRREALRELPNSLTIKRCVKMKLSVSISQKSRRPIGVWKRLKYRTDITARKLVGSIKNFNYFDLWHGSLKDIEGRFGSGYASYFKFFRWLFVLNCFFALLSITLLVIPQIIDDSDSKVTRNFTAEDIFTGFFFDTVLLYGHYSNKTITTIPHITFDMPAAYFSVTIILYLMSFFILAVSVAESYRRTFIETQGGLHNVYAHRVFCGWDFGIATKEAAQLKSSAIYHELKEFITEDMKEPENKTCLFKFWTIAIQVVVNILILVFLVALGWLIWVLLETYKNDTSVVTAIVVNVAIMTVPTVFSYISYYEDYKNPRTAIYVTLIRTYLLGAVILSVILTFWLRNYKTDCWENQLATEIYRLTLFDFFFSVIFSSLIDIIIFVALKLFNRECKTEFNVAKHTLQIIYNQGLFWVGFYYSPLLPTLVTVKMLIIWYVRQGCVRKLCKPPKQTWRAAQAQTIFKTMIFISILMIIAAHLYTLNSVQPSKSCGPFTNYDYTYQILTNNLENFEDTTFGGIVMNITKPGGVAFIIITLVIFVYYTREQALANREKVQMLRDTLVWLTKDKKFLSQWYNEITTNGSFEPSQVQSDEIAARFKKFS